jgi:hypothetical protein
VSSWPVKSTAIHRPVEGQLMAPRYGAQASDEPLGPSHCRSVLSTWAVGHGPTFAPGLVKDSTLPAVSLPTQSVVLGQESASGSSS